MVMNMKTYYGLIMLLLMTLPGCMRELEYPQAEPQKRKECRYIDIAMADGSSVPTGSLSGWVPVGLGKTYDYVSEDQSAQFKFNGEGEAPV
jgi:hypothetical protein